MIGFNYRMTELEAAITRCQLRKLEKVILERQKKGQNGEIHITDSIRKLVLNRNKFIGHIFDGKYLDCGSMKGYINSNLEIILSQVLDLLLISL